MSRQFSTPFLSLCTATLLIVTGCIYGEDESQQTANVTTGSASNNSNTSNNSNSSNTLSPTGTVVSSTSSPTTKPPETTTNNSSTNVTQTSTQTVTYDTSNTSGTSQTGTTTSPNKAACQEACKPYGGKKFETCKAGNSTLMDACMARCLIAPQAFKQKTIAKCVDKLETRQCALALECISSCPEQKDYPANAQGCERPTSLCQYNPRGNWSFFCGPPCTSGNKAACDRIKPSPQCNVAQQCIIADFPVIGTNTKCPTIPNVEPMRQKTLEVENDTKNQVCILTCDADADCESPFTNTSVCDLNSKLCVPDCREEEENLCPSGTTCNKGFCEESCNITKGCEPRFLGGVKVNRKCEGPPFARVCVIKH